jgi:hypothetical protein
MVSIAWFGVIPRLAESGFSLTQVLDYLYAYVVDNNGELPQVILSQSLLNLT